MGRNEILKVFLRDKIILTPEALKLLEENEDIIERVRKRCLEEGIGLLDSRFIEEELSKKRLEINIEKPEEVKEFGIEDLISMLKKRFEFLSPLVVQNNQIKDVFSISKIEKGRNKFQKGVIIGLVKDKTNYTFTLEDLSGCLVVHGEIGDIDKLNIDEVVGVEVYREEERFKAQRFFYPSFTFFRKIEKVNYEVVIESNNLVVEDKKIEINVDKGVRVNIGSIEVFVLNFDFLKYYFRDKPLENLILLLEKRHLNPTIIKDKELYKEDFFLLKEIPEYIIVINSPIQERRIYKGVQIYFLGKNSKVSLKDGKVS
ncbi:MAG: hypothetical protein QXD89_01765 [Candidatus Aenigmatarchaeota archaeon]